MPLPTELSVLILKSSKSNVLRANIPVGSLNGRFFSRAGFSLGWQTIARAKWQTWVTQSELDMMMTSTANGIFQRTFRITGKKKRNGISCHLALVTREYPSHMNRSQETWHCIQFEQTHTINRILPKRTSDSIKWCSVQGVWSITPFGFDVLAMWYISQCIYFILHLPHFKLSFCKHFVLLLNMLLRFLHLHIRISLWLPPHNNCIYVYAGTPTRVGMHFKLGMLSISVLYSHPPHTHAFHFPSNHLNVCVCVRLISSYLRSWAKM